MGHLPAHALNQFERGKPLTAAALNANFLTLLALIENLAREMRTPASTVVALETDAASATKRIEALEHLTAMHARQRNEKEWAPLSHIGALVQMVNGVAREFRTAADQLDVAHAGLGVDHDDLHRRLLVLEQQPQSAMQEDFVALIKDHERIALKEHMLLSQIIALRHEVGLLRELALGRDRQANRLEFAPMSYIGQILQRLNALEAKQ
jgi:hypothetical protein